MGKSRLKSIKENQELNYSINRVCATTIYSRVNPTEINTFSSTAKGNLTQATFQATNQVLPNAKESK